MTKQDLELDNGLILFRQRYQHLVDMMDYYEYYNDSEILVVLKDGTKIIYNIILGQVRKINESYERNINMTESALRDTFASRLCGMMRKRCISRMRLSEMTDISEVTISKYMNGKATPSIYNARKIALALEWNVYEMMDIK